MRTCAAIITVITMLAGSAAFARDSAPPPMGIGEISLYAHRAHDGIQATWGDQYQIDQKTLGLMQTSVSPNADVILTAGRGGRSMHGGSFHGGFRGGTMHGGFHEGFRSFHGDFDHRHHEFRGHNDFHFGLGLGLGAYPYYYPYYPYYPYGGYYYPYGYYYYYYYPYGYYPYGYYYGTPWYFYFSW